MRPLVTEYLLMIKLADRICAHSFNPAAYHSHGLFFLYSKSAINYTISKIPCRCRNTDYLTDDTLRD